MKSKKKAAVIGSGFGGISAAIRLQKLGFETTIFEKRDQPGGRAYVYHDQGFVFDAGPTIITAPHCFEELFELHDRSMRDYVELLPVAPFYRLQWTDGTTYDYDANLDNTLKQISALSPGDVLGYQNFLKYSRDVFEAGYTKLAHVPFLDFKSMLRAGPDLIRLKAYRSVYEQVSRYIKHPKLREAFSFHALLVGGNPFDTSSIYTLIHYLERNWGVFFPRGGTGALVNGLLKLFFENGGELRTDAPVEQILVEGSVVKGLRVEGKSLAFDLVVSNADVMHTYDSLLGGHPRGVKAAQALSRKRWSMSLFLIYFGTSRKYENIAHHTILFGPRYEGLLKDIFKNGTLAEDFSLYLHAPTRTDPSMAPEGCEGFYVLSPVPHLGYAEEIDWNIEGPKYAKKIMQTLEETLLPDLRASIVTQRIFTPLDFKTELNAHVGSAFSLEPILRQSAYFRTHNRDPEVKGLYFVGAGTHPGAGLPGVVNSAKATAHVIEGDLNAGVFDRNRN